MDIDKVSLYNDEECARNRLLLNPIEIGIKWSPFDLGSGVRHRVGAVAKHGHAMIAVSVIQEWPRLEVGRG